MDIIDSIDTWNIHFDWFQDLRKSIPNNVTSKKMNETYVFSLHLLQAWTKHERSKDTKTFCYVDCFHSKYDSSLLTSNGNFETSSNFFCFLKKSRPIVVFLVALKETSRESFWMVKNHYEEEEEESLKKRKKHHLYNNTIKTLEIINLLTAYTKRNIY